MGHKKRTKAGKSIVLNQARHWEFHLAEMVTSQQDPLEIKISNRNVPINKSVPFHKFKGAATPNCLIAKNMELISDF